MNKIQDIRNKNGISQVQLYKTLGWKQTRLSNYENGIRKVGLNEAKKITKALNELGAKVTLEQVFP